MRDHLISDQSQTLSQIQVTSLANMTKGAPWILEQLHVRDHHILLWTTRGQGRVLLHGLRRGFGAHNAIFVPAGKVFSFELGLQVQGLATLIPNDGRATLPDRTQHLRLQDGTEQAELTAILDALRRELHQERALMSEALNAHARLLSVTLRRDIQSAGAQPPARASERIVRRFCDILATEFTSGRPMAWYADQLDITPTHLTRVCRQAAGLTAAEMLSQMVQHRARCLLRDSEAPINRVANALGFGSAAYFTRFCQQHFGASPSQLRKSAQSR
ncbi:MULTISPECIES: helix-turn-helix transcriptional regulator [unclassified Shimia]|uniref:helix-turn-helix transcriptional regulator n=1 Tax=unclassified Shimia TaxID=2630038 RepID=UPI003103BD27